MLFLLYEFLEIDMCVDLKCAFERTKNVLSCILRLNSGSCALFMGPASTFFSTKNFKTGSHDTIHTFKNYFTIILFSVFRNK